MCGACLECFYLSELLIAQGQLLLGTVADGLSSDMARLIDEPNGLPLCPDFGRCIAEPQAAGQKYTVNQMCL